MVKNPPANAGDAGEGGSIPVSGISPGEGNGKSLQYSCLEIPWAAEPSGLQSTGLQRVRHDWTTERAHMQGSFWSYLIVSKALNLETVVKRLCFMVVIIEVMPRAQNTPASMLRAAVGQWAPSPLLPGVQAKPQNPQFLPLQLLQVLRLEASATGFYWHRDLCPQLPLAPALRRWESWKADCPNFLIWEKAKAGPSATPTSLSPPLSLSCLTCCVMYSYLPCLSFSLPLGHLPFSDSSLHVQQCISLLSFPAHLPRQLPLSHTASLFLCVSPSPLSPLSSSAPLVSCVVSRAAWQFLLSHPVTLLLLFGHYSLRPHGQ